MPACLRYKSAVTGSRQTGRLYQSFAWRGPWEKAQRLPTVRSAPLHEGKRRRRKKSNSHTAARPSHTGAGALDTQLALQLGPAQKRRNQQKYAHHQEAALYPHFRRPTPGGVEAKLLGPGVGRALSSHPRVYFILFVFTSGAREQPPSQDPRSHGRVQAVAAAHIPSRLFPGSRRK